MSNISHVYNYYEFIWLYCKYFRFLSKVISIHIFSLFLSLGIILWFCRYFFFILSSELRIKTQIWPSIFSSSHFYGFFSITLFFTKGKLEWSKLTSCFVCFNLMAMFSSNQIRWFIIICNGATYAVTESLHVTENFAFGAALFLFSVFSVLFPFSPIFL